MNLRDLQHQFQSILLNQQCQSAQWVATTGHGLPALSRLNIYHTAYRARLADVLLDTFGHTAQYLGDEWFHQLATDFVQSHQSTDPNIGRYGQAFPDYLAQQLPGDMDVAELALMDWTLRRAFDGANGAPLTLEQLQAMAASDDAQIRLVAVPTATLIRQQFNTLEIWQALNNDQTPPGAQALDEPIEVLFWRQSHSPHFRSLSTLEAAALRCVLPGCPLDAIGHRLAASFPDVDVATEFGGLLSRWIDDQLVIGEA